MTSPHPWLAGVVLSLLALGLETPWVTAGGLSPGAEVFAVAPERVLEISYRTAACMVVAHRFRREERFTLVFLKPGQSHPETCRAGDGFQEVVRSLTSLRLRRLPTPQETAALLRRQPLSGWGELVIRDDSALEPFRARVLPAGDSPEEAWLHFQGTTYLVALSHEVLARLTAGCRGVTGPGPQPR